MNNDKSAHDNEKKIIHVHSCWQYCVECTGKSDWESKIY